MEAKFWQEKWKSVETPGFHKSEYHPQLVKNYPLLELSPNDPFLIPLCGKSLDLKFMADKGHKAIGFELSIKAVNQFFHSHKIKAIQSDVGPFKRFQSEYIDIYCGDFFKWREANLPAIRGVFDRAALVALPPKMRQEYYQVFGELLTVGSQILLIAFEYDQNLLAGPPFSVPASEVSRNYASHFNIKKLSACEVEISNPRFHQAGLTHFQEVTYLLTKK
ncbi:MAG: thiopurine S-methyltransferase [Halobacteriovoraceae bacterium]|nr:thiopurine S-methyltransferase [Halobacteriovoraceae bacterium]MBT5094903.1 thiopurine S-methyltransferase [Halobacteriovoraceae bacterium]